MKRIVSLCLLLSVLLGCAVCFGGCSGDEGKDFPVTVGGVTIDKAPSSVVVLNDSLADIVAYIGYDDKLVARADGCDQEFLRYLPSVGSAAQPDVNAILDNSADLVIADSILSEATRTELKSKGVTVLVLDPPAEFSGLQKIYADLGSVFGGNSTGKAKGEKAYQELADMLSQYKTAVTGVVKTSVYLYLDGDGRLCTFTKGSLQQKIFDYNGSMNALVNQEKALVDPTELRLSTPTFIFYDDARVLSYLSSDEKLAHLSALRNGKVCQIPLKSFYRYGSSCEEAVYQMVHYMNQAEHPATVDEATPDEATPDED